ncbi:unnamed protein product, partial [Mesorhabditis belari]|uniref:PCI domain-containing protein n=1 Tax=Mesorhabditis belari TaxID=2138241 RepID=A0AAF3EFF3_9BILA
MTFCQKFERRAEFRKLTEILRLHLAQIQRHQHLQHAVKLSAPESLIMMQETRLLQLDTAIRMELWQEAYKSAEDAHGIMQLSKDKDRRIVKPSSYVNYYEKLALIYWKADNQLFHAAALLQKFVIHKDMKRTFAYEDAQEQATRVLLAALSIPEGAALPSDLTRMLDIETQHGANVRVLTNLLRLPITPTRDGILREAARQGIFELASNEAQALYKLMEESFKPNFLVKLAEVELGRIVEKKCHDQYVESLRSAFATKALSQISLIYESVSWTRLRAVLPYFNDLQLEYFLADAGKRRFIKANIDHQANCVKFGSYDEATLAENVDLEDARGFTGDSTQLGIDGVRSHLQLMHHKLQKMVEHLDGEERRVKIVGQIKKCAGVYLMHKSGDYERIQQRKRKIEMYKVEREKRAKLILEQVLTERNTFEEQKRAEEQIHLVKLGKEHELLRQKNAKREVEDKIRADKMQRLRSSVMYQEILKEYTEEQLLLIDPEEIVCEQRERIDQQRQKQQQRLQQQWKNFDHMARSFHLEDAKEYRAVEEVRRTRMPKLFDGYEERRVAAAIADHENAVKFWTQSQMIAEDANDWACSVKDGHAEDFKTKMMEYREKLEAVRNDRLAARAAKRRLARVQEWEDKKAEAEKARLKAEEEARKKKYEDECRERREQRMQERQQAMTDTSRAMADSNWRGPAQRPTPRPEMVRKECFDTQRQGPSEADKAETWRTKPDAPTHHAIPVARSDAEKMGSWRDGLKPAPTHGQSVSRSTVSEADKGAWSRQKPHLSSSTSDAKSSAADAAASWRKPIAILKRGDSVNTHSDSKEQAQGGNNPVDATENKDREFGKKDENAAPSGKYVAPGMKEKLPQLSILAEKTNKPIDAKDEEEEEEGNDWNVVGGNKKKTNILAKSSQPASGSGSVHKTVPRQNFNRGPW